MSLSGVPNLHFNRWISLRLQRVPSSATHLSSVFTSFPPLRGVCRSLLLVVLVKTWVRFPILPFGVSINTADEEAQRQQRKCCRSTTRRGFYNPFRAVFSFSTASSQAAMNQFLAVDSQLRKTRSGEKRPERNRRRENATRP